jgi:hypothetical protein
MHIFASINVYLHIPWNEMRERERERERGIYKNFIPKPTALLGNLTQLTT